MEAVLAVQDTYRAQEWARVIQECSASGMTKREFCRQQLQKQMAEAAAPQPALS